MEYVGRHVYTVCTDDVCSTIEQKRSCSYEQLIDEAMRRLNAFAYNARVISVNENKYSFMVHQQIDDPNTWYTMKVYELTAFIATELPQDVRPEDVPKIFNQ